MQAYTIGVMRAAVEEADPGPFQQIVATAAARVEEALAEMLNLQVEVFDFPGPHLTPMAAGYAPLHFLRLGLAEKLERKADFLLLVTEVDLSSTALSYVVALPSQLTNVAVLSTKRLSPTFWGREADETLTVSRLSSLMLHTLGHLFNLPHQDDPANVMYDFGEVQELAKMTDLRPEQMDQIRRNLPREAREEVATEEYGRFALAQLLDNAPAIWQAVRRANPLALTLKMPTMLTTALSVDIVLFFTAEIWDVASTLSFSALLLFSLLAVGASTALLYRAFKLGPEQARGRRLAESTVVTIAATVTTLLLAILLLYLFFLLLTLVSGLTFFPEALKATWPTVDPAVRFAEHLKLGLFLGAMGVLSGSLGGRADSKQVIRHVLFLDEET